MKKDRMEIIPKTEEELIDAESDFIIIQQGVNTIKKKPIDVIIKNMGEKQKKERSLELNIKIVQTAKEKVRKGLKKTILEVCDEFWFK